jgi:hypothetical protein
MWAVLGSIAAATAVGHAVFVLVRRRQTQRTAIQSSESETPAT